MIYIVIDKSEFSETDILAVYGEPKLAEDFIASIPPEEAEFVQVVPWNIVKNQRGIVLT